jgi:hypothetical protein
MAARGRPFCYSWLPGLLRPGGRHCNHFRHFRWNTGPGGPGGLQILAPPAVAA